VRIVFILLAVIIVCTWLGLELRRSYRDVAHVLLGLAVLLTLLLLGAALRIY
jgi:hypothetical protein